jgi:two-component system CheB/CheR fusion protein
MSLLFEKGLKMAEKKKPAKEKRAAAKPNVNEDFYIVGMGASAGGLEAFEKFFQNMPNDSGMGFILVPHLDPTHVSLMPELVQKSSKMDVIQVKDGIEVKPNTVYIVPPNHDLAILNRTLQLMDSPKTLGPRIPIDFFFRSLAEDQGDKSICIILSGMGTDGTLGLRAIKGELGMAMVHLPDSAKYNSMPKSGIETDLVDYILPSEKMPEQLIAYAKHATKKVAPKVIRAQGKVPDVLQKIFILLRIHTGHDFSSYKKNTIYRRIEKRMKVHQIDKITTYVRLLQDFEGNILDWNKGAERMYGFSKAEALKMNISDIIPKEKQKETLGMIKKIKEGEDIKSFKTNRKTRDGKILDVWLTVTKLVDTESQTTQIATTERNLAWLSEP